MSVKSWDTLPEIVLEVVFSSSRVSRFKPPWLWYIPLEVVQRVEGLVIRVLELVLRLVSWAVEVDGAICILF